MSQAYDFFRTIVAADRSWAAIDWQGTNPHAIDGPRLAQCLSGTPLAQLAATLPICISLDAAALGDTSLTSALGTLGPDRAVLVLAANTVDAAPTLARCNELRRRGHHFALRIDRRQMIGEVPHAFSHLWIDAALTRQDFSAYDFAFIDETGLRTIAATVDSYEMFGWLVDKGFYWSDSHFLTTQNPLNARAPDLTRLKLLKLLNLVRQDGDTHAIEEVFREEPKLSYNLLRLVNSAALGCGTRITNFAQAITILGRRQLQRWLQLLVYANHLADGSAPNPLMQMAARRARQMELLSTALAPQPAIDDISDNAFMVGLFSLLEVLINLPARDILKEVPIPDATAEALLLHSQGGVLGQLLASIVAAEAGDFAGAEATLRELGIGPAEHAKAQIEALHWAVNINIGLV